MFGNDIAIQQAAPAPARLLIYKNRVILDNPTVQQHFDEITLENLRPFSKNPTICKFMIQLGRFDELGSGVRNINKYLPLYANGAKPVFKETIHGFELKIPLKKESKAETNGQLDSEPGKRPRLRPELRPKLRPESKIESPLAIKIIKLLPKKEMGKVQLASELGHKTVSGELKKQIKRYCESCWEIKLKMVQGQLAALNHKLADLRLLFWFSHNFFKHIHAPDP